MRNWVCVGVLPLPRVRAPGAGARRMPGIDVPEHIARRAGTRHD
ncbi:hypothetical protein [Streptomyces sp. MUM 16J]|nr:hypothetical protein [Streptomyces sp. MUM 16J]